MTRDLRPPKAASSAAPPEAPRIGVRRSDAVKTGAASEGWTIPEWTGSPAEQITIATCRAISQLAAVIEQNGVTSTALARLKNVQAGLSEILKRGFDDLDRKALTRMYRLCVTTQRALKGIPRADQPRGWDARLFTVHAEFSLVIEELLARQKGGDAIQALAERKLESIARKAFDLAQEIEALGPQERAQLRLQVSGTLARAFETSDAHAGSMGENDGATPSAAPELWVNRQAYAGETALGFLQRVYGDRLANMRLVDIASLDQPLYHVLQTWRRRNNPPAHLKAFFARERRSRAEIDAELKKYKIRKPEDAFVRFPDDKATAQRLYQAARARLTR